MSLTRGDTERQVPDACVGLCSACRHAAVQRNPRGSRFWRCRRADSDTRYQRYPPLPVEVCPGFERRTS